jgi:hypothetical protein
MTDPRSPALPDEVRERIDAFLRPAREVAVIDRLPLPKLVEDYCEKFVALDRTGQPAAFIALSPPGHPESVREAADMSRTVRERLAEPWASAVLTPWFVGELDGRSYSITAYCPPISRGRWSGRWQRLRLAGPILDWLAGVSRASVRDIDDVHAAVREPLLALAGHVRSDDTTRLAAKAALDDLDRGLWRPRSVVAHNDLWWGNFVRRPQGDRARIPFQVIDWAGASVQGVPFYDLVRVASSLELGRLRFRRALRIHCAILGCRPEHSRHYLCVAFGRLLRNLGEWPEEQFVGTARSCLRYVDDALGAPPAPSAAAMK